MDLDKLIQTLNFSSVTWQIMAPVIFSLGDIITGFIQAVINNDVKTYVMREGLLHKVLIILIVLLSFVADVTFSLHIISKVVCIYVILMETLSVCENLTKAGIDLKYLTKILNIEGKEEEK